jgi:hypothetical protein
MNCFVPPPVLCNRDHLPNLDRSGHAKVGESVDECPCRPSSHPISGRECGFGTPLGHRCETALGIISPIGGYLHTSPSTCPRRLARTLLSCPSTVLTSNPMISLAMTSSGLKLPLRPDEFCAKYDVGRHRAGEPSLHLYPKPSGPSSRPRQAQLHALVDGESTPSRRSQDGTGGRDPAPEYTVGT